MDHHDYYMTQKKKTHCIKYTTLYQSNFFIPTVDQKSSVEKVFDNMDGHSFEHYCAGILKKMGIKKLKLLAEAEIKELIYWQKKME